ncbi:hypothetical protein DC20_12580 [Rufibacter tibetensis]|uniref:Uncharacterized protein n=2 Tax=Rufibacter tibetensis TaxID=512763 RepID=A0A0N7HWM4_9BACT|nr:hypothetical protein DC20_12580 [Rufibacter tibetensis]
MATYSARNGDGPAKKDKRRVYVKVYDSSDIVWFDALKGQFKKDNEVSFDYDVDKRISLDGAKNVKKLRAQKDYIPQDLLSKVALLAALLLLGTVAIESRTKR